MDALKIFRQPYLGIYTTCFLWQTEHHNIWIDAGIREGWNDRMREYLSNGKQNILLLTHGHWDHIGGVAQIRKNGGVVYAHPQDRRHLTDLEWHWSLLFGQFEKDFDLPPERYSTFWRSVEAPSDLDRPVLDGERLIFDDLIFCVLAAPGHSAGSVCYLEEQTGTLFTGDAVMGNGFFSGIPQIEDFDDYMVSMERLKSISVSRVLTDHTDQIPGTELAGLAQTSQDCAERLLKAARARAAKQADGDLRLGDIAAAIAQAEGKAVNGGACVTAHAALRQMTNDPRARHCAANYFCGMAVGNISHE